MTRIERCEGHKPELAAARLIYVKAMDTHRARLHCRIGIDAMLNSLLRYKTVASLIMGAWLFVVFVGITHACGLGHVTAMPHDPVASQPGGESSAHDMSYGCDELRTDDLVVIATAQPVQNPRVGQPLVLAAHRNSGFAAIPAPILGRVRAAHPSLVVPLSIRFLRLTL